jgi:hypothetical protein
VKGVNPRQLGQPVVLLWNPPLWAPRPGRWEECSITHDRARLPEARAVVFHIPTLGPVLRLPKPAGQVWVAWSMESAVMYPVLADAQYLLPFDLTMTYRFDSDLPVPYFEPQLLEDLATPPSAKTESAPAVLFLSNEGERSGRTEYLRELMRHLEVDSFGRALRNRTLALDRGRETLRRVIRGYRFTLAFENSIDTDYVTEKFFGPLGAGSVPVYLGAPNIEDFAPGAGCYVDVRAFAGPRELAAHLSALAADEAAYAQLQAWRARPLLPEFRRRLSLASASPFRRLAQALARRSALAPEEENPS